MTRVLIVGGGLAGSLLALRLTERRDVEVRLLERGERLGGNHTWSFHEGDLTPAQRRCVDPLVERRWSGHEVRFPAHTRRLRGGYASVTPRRLEAAVGAALGGRLSRGTPVAEVRGRGVVLEDGGERPADVVFDARGPLSPPSAVPVGYQVFLGQDLELSADHGLDHPLIMDATVEQEGGFRFVYVLPWSARTALVEDTCYGGPLLDRERSRARIAAWARREGWAVRRVAREEEGVLPLPLGGRVEDLWPPGSGAVPLGVRAGLFHPTTGYSLPEAVRAAESIAALPALEAAAALSHVQARARARWRAQAFFRLLNRLLMEAARPRERYRVLERFYRLPEPLLARFYAGTPTLADKARVLAGRPPVPVLRALRALRPWAAAALGALP